MPLSLANQRGHTEVAARLVAAGSIVDAEAGAQHRSLPQHRSVPQPARLALQQPMTGRLAGRTPAPQTRDTLWYDSAQKGNVGLNFI